MSSNGTTDFIAEVLSHSKNHLTMFVEFPPDCLLVDLNHPLIDSLMTTFVSQLCGDEDDNTLLTKAKVWYTYFLNCDDPSLFGIYDYYSFYDKYPILLSDGDGL
jgi:hypothetical protein